MSSTSQAVPGRETIADLARVPGKAELIGGRIVHLMPTGFRPNLIAVRILRSLADHIDTIGQGVALTDNMGYTVPVLPSGRESFSPDVSCYAGPFSMDDRRFIPEAPTLAVEARSENDYGAAAKRADYFAAGTAVVWDVDPKADCLHVYRPDAPDLPTTFQRGQIAHAEPAVPGWQIEVDRFFP